ncbi:hypothetical protein [Clostridium baratii]|uniref:hypothetical protein n=1 Tax=Clostridium baratii TaxID=1561 RepID=UPI0030D0651C
MKLFKKKEIYKPKYKVGELVEYCIDNSESFILKAGVIVKIEGKKYFITNNNKEGFVVRENDITRKIITKTKTRFVFECSNCKTISNDLKMIGLATVCPKCGSDKITCLEVIE